MTDFVFENDTEYRKGCFVIIDLHEREHLFGKIVTIFCENPNVPILILTVFETVEFDYHVVCHRVKEKYPPETQFCRIDQLKDFHPLDFVRDLGEIRYSFKIRFIKISVH